MSADAIQLTPPDPHLPSHTCHPHATPAIATGGHPLHPSSTLWTFPSSPPSPMYLLCHCVKLNAVSPSLGHYRLLPNLSKVPTVHLLYALLVCGSTLSKGLLLRSYPWFSMYTTLIGGRECRVGSRAVTVTGLSCKWWLYLVQVSFRPWSLNTACLYKKTWRSEGGREWGTGWWFWMWPFSSKCWWLNG